MEQLEQLRRMRDEARLRIAATADYKLATSLDALIADLEQVLGVSSDDGQSATEDDGEAEEPALLASEPEPDPGPEPEEPEEDDDDSGVTADLSKALAEQLERETAAEVADEDSDDEPVSAGSAPGNGSSDGHDDDSESEDSEEDALIRAMRELDEDLARADIGSDRDRSK